MTKIADGVWQGQANSFKDSTLAKKATSIKHWEIYTQKDLKIPSTFPIPAGMSRYQITEGEINLRVTLAIGYAVKLINMQHVHQSTCNTCWH